LDSVHTISFLLNNAFFKVKQHEIWPKLKNKSLTFTYKINTVRYIIKYIFI
jgi:hypothetical protein